MNTEVRKIRIARFIKRLSVINLVSLIIIYVSVCFFYERDWLAVVLTRVPHILGIFPVIMFISAAIRRDKRLIALNAAALVFWAVALAGFNVPLRAFGGASGHSLRVMTYNVRQGQFGHMKLVDAVKEQNPDILCLQEVYAIDKYGDPVKTFAKHLPGRWYVARVGEVATFSRYPILSERAYRLPQETDRDILEVTLNVKDTRMTVLNTHLNIGRAEWLKTEAGKSLIGDVDMMSMVLLEEVKMVVEKADQAGENIIIAGDFNLAPLGPTYRRIATKYKDAFRTAGFGFGYTCNAKKPWIRIDYVFTDKQIRVKNCFVPSAIASDHRAVVADLIVPN